MRNIPKIETDQMIFAKFIMNVNLFVYFDRFFISTFQIATVTEIKGVRQAHKFLKIMHGT